MLLHDVVVLIDNKEDIDRFERVTNQLVGMALYKENYMLSVNSNTNRQSLCSKFQVVDTRRPTAVRTSSAKSPTHFDPPCRMLLHDVCFSLTTSKIWTDSTGFATISSAWRCGTKI